MVILIKMSFLLHTNFAKHIFGIYLIQYIVLKQCMYKKMYCLNIFEEYTEYKVEDF